MNGSLLVPVLLALQGSDAPCTVQRAELRPPAVVSPYTYGTALALAGRFAAVGSWLEGAGGAVHLFEEREGRWQPSSVLEPPGARPGDRFGDSLALDAARLFVSAPGTRAPAGGTPGSLYVYELAGGAWELQSQVFADGSSQPESFGSSIAVSEDRILAGAPFAGDLGIQSGAAYVFRREGEAWVQEARLLPDPAAASQGASYGAFGFMVVMDGEIALIGAPGLSLVYCYRRAGRTWSLEQVLTGQQGARFGEALALDGSTALVGVALSGPLMTGSVPVYERLAEGWRHTETITRARPSTFGFGGYVALDDGLAAIGSIEFGIYPSNGTWLVERRGDRWSEPLAVVPLGSQSYALGDTVALDARRLLVGELVDGPTAFVLDVGRAAGGSILERQGPGNLHSLSAGRASIGRMLTFEVGPNPAVFYSPRIFGFEAPASLPLGGGTFLCDPDSELLFLSPSLGGGAGATHDWSISIPPARELAGFSFCAQAFFRSSVSQPLLFTNALDIELGSCVCPDDRPTDELSSAEPNR